MKVTVALKAKIMHQQHLQREPSVCYAFGSASSRFMIVARRLAAVGRPAAVIAHEIKTAVQHLADTVYFFYSVVAEAYALRGAYRATFAERMVNFGAEFFARQVQILVPTAHPY